MTTLAGAPLLLKSSVLEAFRGTTVKLGTIPFGAQFTSAANGGVVSVVGNTVRNPGAFPATMVTLPATAVASARMLVSLANEKISEASEARVVPPVEVRVSTSRTGEARGTKPLPVSVAEPV